METPSLGLNVFHCSSHTHTQILEGQSKEKKPPHS